MLLAAREPTKRWLRFQSLSCFAENNDQNYRHSLICPSLSNNALNQWKRKGENLTVAHVCLSLPDKVTLKNLQSSLGRFSCSAPPATPYLLLTRKTCRTGSLPELVCLCVQVQLCAFPCGLWLERWEEVQAFLTLS